MRVKPERKRSLPILGSRLRREGCDWPLETSLSQLPDERIPVLARHRNIQQRDVGGVPFQGSSGVGRGRNGFRSALLTAW